MAMRVATRSASAAGLSIRMRLMRGKRIASFDLWRLLEWIERRRGRRFENRQIAFFAIILPLALAAFWLVRLLV